MKTMPTIFPLCLLSAISMCTAETIYQAVVNEEECSSDCAVQLLQKESTSRTHNVLGDKGNMGGMGGMEDWVRDGECQSDSPWNGRSDCSSFTYQALCAANSGCYWAVDGMSGRGGHWGGRGKCESNSPTNWFGMSCSSFAYRECVSNDNCNWVVEGR